MHEVSKFGSSKPCKTRLFPIIFPPFFFPKIKNKTKTKKQEHLAELLKSCPRKTGRSNRLRKPPEDSARPVQDKWTAQYGP